MFNNIGFAVLIKNRTVILEMILCFLETKVKEVLKDCNFTSKVFDPHILHFQYQV